MNKNNLIDYVRDASGKRYYSQAGQDLFVQEMLLGKVGGVYCEVGGAHPYESNNTILLESEFGWHGVSVELNPELVSLFNSVRNNQCICADATLCDYQQLFEERNFPKQVDYLSLDIDPANITYAALKCIPFDFYRFSVITYEHDSYSCGEEHMRLSREYLSSLGYQLVIGNVRSFGRDFEDWWVDPLAVSESIWGRLRMQGAEFSEILSLCRNRQD